MFIAADKSRQYYEMDTIKGSAGDGVVVAAEAGQDVLVAAKDSGDFLVVPEEAVFFVGGLFEEWEVAEDDDLFLVPESEIEFPDEPFELACANGAAVEGCLDDITVIFEQMAVGFGPGFVDD